MLPTFSSSAPYWSPDIVYSRQQRIQPYNNEQFLNQIFNFNNQSITAFQSLSHQLKLKFFLSVEEMKLLGYMNDKQGYQSILQQIARRKLLITAPEPVKLPKVVGEKEQWGAKLEHLCEDHLKKIQKDNFLDDIPIQFPIAHHEQKQVDFLTGQTIIGSNNKTSDENDDDQFEWAESGQNRQIPELSNVQVDQPLQFPVTNHIQADKKQQKIIQNEDQQFGQFCQDNVNQPVFQASTTVTTTNQLNGGLGDVFKVQIPPVYVEPVKMMQHIDVWDLQVLQDESPKKVHQVSQKQIGSPKKIASYSSITSRRNQNQKQNPAQQQQMYTQSSITHNQMNSHSVQSSHLFASSNHVVVGGVSDVFGDLSLLDGFTFQPQSQKLPIGSLQLVQPTLVSQTSKKSSGKQSQQGSNPSISQSNITPAATPQTTNNVAPVLYDIDFDFLGPTSSSQNIPTPTLTQTQSTPSAITQFNNQQLYNSFVAPHSSQISNAGENSMSKSQPLDTSFGLDLSGLDNTFNFNNVHGISNEPNTEYFKKKFATNQQQQFYESEQNIEEPQGAPSTILTTIDKSLLENLIVRTQTKTLQSFLSKKLFDFDRKFYKEALNLLQVLGYKNNPDFTYIKEQSEICKEIYRLTQMFSAAVDQDREQQVRQSLQKTKSLYKNLNAKKTTMIVKKYMKLQGKSLDYQIGKLCLEGGVPKDLLAKAIQTRKNSQNSFQQIAALLYLMGYFGGIYNVSVFTCHVTEYVQKIVHQMESFAQQLSTFNPELVILIKNNTKFMDYKQNIRKIFLLTQRIIKISSYCIKDSLLPQTLTLSQKLPKLPNQTILPSHITTFFRNLAENNCINIYKLHAQMNELMNLHPICCLCLDSVDLGSGSKRNDEKFYHFVCYNFRSKISNWKEESMKMSQIQIEQRTHKCQQVSQTYEETGYKDINNVNRIEKQETENNKQQQEISTKTTQAEFQLKQASQQSMATYYQTTETQNMYVTEMHRQKQYIQLNWATNSIYTSDINTIGNMNTTSNISDTNTMSNINQHVASHRIEQPIDAMDGYLEGFQGGNVGYQNDFGNVLNTQQCQQQASENGDEDQWQQAQVVGSQPI